MAGRTLEPPTSLIKVRALEPLEMPSTNIAKQPRSSFEQRDRHESGVFFRQWLRRPKTLGSVTPSSPFLARAVAEVIQNRPAPVVIELGGGTGPITQGLLAHGLPPEQLVVVELDRKLHAYLSRRFPQLRVIRGDATKLGQLVAEHGITDVGCVVSGIPMVNMPLDFQRSIINEALGIMPKGGSVVQYSYSPVPPIKHREIGVTAKRERFVLLNIPPAGVWRFSRTSEAVA